MNKNILVETFIERIEFQKIDYKTDKPFYVTYYLPVIEIINLLILKKDVYVFGDVYFDGEDYCMINFDGLFSTFSYLCLSDIKYIKNKARKNSIKSKDNLKFVGNYFKMTKKERIELFGKAIKEEECISQTYYVEKSMKDIDDEYKRVCQLDFFLKGGTKKQNIYNMIRYYDSIYDGIGDELTSMGLDVNKLEITFAISLLEHDEEYIGKDLESDFYIPINGIYTEEDNFSLYAFINEIGEVILMNEKNLYTYESFLYDFINEDKDEYVKKIIKFKISDIKHPDIDSLEFIYYLPDLENIIKLHSI